MTDYDDLCNGAGEWKNIQPVVRSALFGEAEDMITLKSHLVEFNKKLLAEENMQKSILEQQSKPDEALSTALSTMGEKFKQFERETEKRLEDLEEKYLESEHASKLRQERLAARIQQIEENLSEELEVLEKHDVEQVEISNESEEELKELKSELKAEKSMIASAKDVDELKQTYVSEEKLREGLSQLSTASNDAIARLELESKQNFEEFKEEIQNNEQTILTQIEEVVEEHTEKIPTESDIQELAKAVVSDETSVFATKSAVQQIAQKLQEKELAAETEAIDAVREVSEESEERSSEHAQIMHEVMEKEAEYTSNMEGRLLELSELPELDKKIAKLELEIAQKMDSGSLAGRSFVTTQELDEEVTNALRSCEKQIKAEVEGFIDNELYRTVKSIIKAELDIEQTHSRSMLEEELETAEERIMKKITREISPEEELNRINQQCDDVRSLIDMLSSDVDFKLTKNIEVEDEKLTAEISSVRHAIDSLNNVVYSQNDLVACKMKEFDMQVGNTQGSSQPTAKWLWKSKKLTQQNAVIWSSEELNTLQSNFIWERSKSQILIVAAGCYQFKFAVFTRKRPTVQILVNGEPIISAMSGGVQPALYSVPKLQASQCYFCEGLQDWLYLASNSVVQLVIGSDFSSCLSGFLEVVKMW